MSGGSRRSLRLDLDVSQDAVVDAMHYTTIARILADARLPPHRSRYWKTATIDERCTTRAAKILWR